MNKTYILIIKKDDFDFKEILGIPLLYYHFLRARNQNSSLFLVTEDQKYIDFFNNCKLEKDSGQDSKMELYRQYKFVIAFENSRANDYVTEKFYDPLLAGAVPIYLGAPNIETFAPGENCSVDIRNFSSPKELAAFLIEACKNEKIYNKFLQWKKEPLKPEFMKKIEAQRVHPFIRLCHLLHLPPPTSRYYGARKKNAHRS